MPKLLLAIMLTITSAVFGNAFAAEPDPAEVEELRQLARAGDKEAQLRLRMLYADGQIATSESADLSSPEATLAGYIDSLRTGRASGVLERYDGMGFYLRAPVPILNYEVIEKITFDPKEAEEWQGVPSALPGDVELQVRQTESDAEYTTSFWLRNVAGEWKIYSHARWDLGPITDEEVAAASPDATADPQDTEQPGDVPFTTAEKEIARLYGDLQSALGARGYEVGPPIISITPNPDFTGSLSRFIEENALDGIPGAAEALDVELYTACFWLDDQLRCPLECSTNIMLVGGTGLLTAQSYVVECPGYDTTIVPLP